MPADVSKEDERRYSRRKAVRIALAFRILQEGFRLSEMRLSGTAHGEIRDLGLQGVGIEVPQIIVDGLHIGQVTEAHPEPRVFLEWDLPDGQRVRAVCRTVYCERVANRLYQVGLRYGELSQSCRAALERFVLPPTV